MATNKLFEAAAEILAAGKGKNAMPPQKLEGEIQVAGGPTPENAKPDDDSHKMTFTSKSATAPSTKPSNASSKMEETEVENEEEVIEEGGWSGRRDMGIKQAHEKTPYGSLEDRRKATVAKTGPRKGMITKQHAASLKSRIQTRMNMNNEDVEALLDIIIENQDELKPQYDATTWKQQMREDVDALFSDDANISEEFKTKVSTIFEARVQDRVAQIEEEINSEYAAMLEEAIDTVKQELTEQIDDYVGYIVEQWMEENQIAIETGIRSEITEDFINGLRNLFAEHYIDVPSEKIDLVDELASKVDELEVKLDEEVERSVEYRKALMEAHKEVIAHEVCEGLTATQVEKIKSLVESVDYSTEEEYREKLETIRENYFPSGVKKANASQLNEQVEQNNEKVTDSFMSSIVQSISKTTRI